jgi:hypothetical protein
VVHSDPVTVSDQEWPKSRHELLPGRGHAFSHGADESLIRQIPKRSPTLVMRAWTRHVTAPVLYSLLFGSTLHLKSPQRDTTVAARGLLSFQ